MLLHSLVDHPLNIPQKGQFHKADIPYLSSLIDFSEHDNGRESVFPHHPPEVSHSVDHGSLGCYVSISLLVTLGKNNDKYMAL